jgi:outer membrane protein TolC
LTIKTLQAWTEVVGAQRQQMVLRHARTELEQLQTKIERRAEQGVSTQSEVKLSQLKVALVKQLLSQTKMQEDLAWLKLKQWVPEADTLRSLDVDQQVPLKDSQAQAIRNFCRNVLDNNIFQKSTKMMMLMTDVTMQKAIDELINYIKP